MIIGGIHLANALMQKLHTSITVGHSHVLDYKQDIDANGKRIHALVSGCYFEHHESYANQSNLGWWRGVCMKRNVKAGNYDLELVSMEQIKRKYA